MLRHSPVPEWAETVSAPARTRRGREGVSGFYKMFHFVESVGGRGFFALEIPPLLELNQSGKTVLPDSRSSPNKSAASPSVPRLQHEFWPLREKRRWI
jgi:hypothetical protein